MWGILTVFTITRVNPIDYGTGYRHIIGFAFYFFWWLENCFSSGVAWLDQTFNFPFHAMLDFESCSGRDQGHVWTYLISWKHLNIEYEITWWLQIFIYYFHAYLGQDSMSNQYVRSGTYSGTVWSLGRTEIQNQPCIASIEVKRLT